MNKNTEILAQRDKQHLQFINNISLRLTKTDFVIWLGSIVLLIDSHPKIIFGLGVFQGAALFCLII